MNKTDAFLLSGSPFGFNAFFQNFKKRMASHVEFLYLHRDPTFFKEYDTLIERFYREVTDGWNVDMTTLPSEEKCSEELTFRKKFLIEACKRSTSGAFLSIHEDVFVLNEDVFQHHIDLIQEKKNDLVFVTFGMGCKDAHDIVKQYPKVVACHNNKQTEYQAYTHCSYGICMYWLMQKEMLADDSLTLSHRVTKPGDIIEGVLDTPYVVKEGGYFEPTSIMLMQIYKKGYQNVYPFTSADFIDLHDLKQIEKFEQYKKIGLVHQSGARMAKWILDLKAPIGYHCFGDAIYNEVFIERYFTFLVSPVIFFDFDKYPYMKGLFYDVLLPKIQSGLERVNEINHKSIKINKAFILEYGRKLELETFPQNLNFV